MQGEREQALGFTMLFVKHANQEKFVKFCLMLQSDKERDAVQREIAKESNVKKKKNERRILERRESKVLLCEDNQ